MTVSVDLSSCLVKIDDWKSQKHDLEYWHFLLSSLYQWRNKQGRSAWEHHQIRHGTIFLCSPLVNSAPRKSKSKKERKKEKRYFLNNQMKHADGTICNFFTFQGQLASSVQLTFNVWSPVWKLFQRSHFAFFSVMAGYLLLLPVRTELCRPFKSRYLPLSVLSNHSYFAHILTLPRFLPGLFSNLFKFCWHLAMGSLFYHTLCL